VILTTPKLLKPSACSIEGCLHHEAGFILHQYRPRPLVTDNLVEARSGHLAGAGVDVAYPEPLPADHPLWAMPNLLMTPHVAIYGTPYRDKWEAILIESCRRFAAGEPLLNVVDQEKWF
jgi:phosphoglycerate dehydrogenase-like enzyme